MSDAVLQERLATGKVKAFVSNFGERIFHLACHAAIPVVLSPELLHLLRINFFLDPPESLPFTVESDILLSPLCSEIGGSLYEISPSVRDVLLGELATNAMYGEQRIREVASLLWQYSERSLRWNDNVALERSQQLTALNFLDAFSAKRWLDTAQESIHQNAASDREWFIAMRDDLQKIDAVLQAQSIEDLSHDETSYAGLKLLTSIPAHEKPIGRISWSWDGNRLASPSADGTIKVWDANTGHLILTLQGHTDRAICVSWSGADDYLASGSDDRTAKIWDTTSGTLIQTIEAGSGVASLSWSGDGRMLALGLNDSTVLLWLQNGGITRTLAGPVGRITALKWSPKATHLAASSEDEKRIYVWNIKKEQPPPRSLEHDAYVLDIDWSPDGQMIVAGCSDNTVRLWGARNERLIRTLRGHTDIVNAVSFSSDGRLIASKSHDSTVRIWRLDNGKTVTELGNQGAHFILAGLAFNPKRPQLATLSNRDTTINIWQLDANMLLGAADRATETLVTSAKIILLGEGGVGKTSLTQSIVTTELSASLLGDVGASKANIARSPGFTDSTASLGERVYRADSLTLHMPGGLKCETFVWDVVLPDPLLARLLLFDTNLVLLLFDNQLGKESLSLLERYWKSVSGKKRAVWIAMEREESGSGLTEREVEWSLLKRGREYVFVNLRTGKGLNELVELLKQRISSRLYERIVFGKSAPEVDASELRIVREHILMLKQQKDPPIYFYGVSELCDSLNAIYEYNRFKRRQLRQILRQLQLQGLVQLLRAKNEEVVWLDPIIINRLLESLVKAARGNAQDPGIIEESRLMNLIYADRLLKQLDGDVIETLLDAATNLLIQRKICLRSVRNQKPVLVFSALADKGETRADSVPQSSFDKLLEWLSPNREIAGNRYEEIRRRLVRLFQHRGVTSAEDLADETIERVTNKVEQISGSYIGDPALYFYGVAKNIYLEYARKSVSPSLPPLSIQTIDDGTVTLDIKYECLERCLESLPQHSRELILEYYAEEKKSKLVTRELMGKRLQITQNSLRVRVQRIRMRLQDCVRNCIDKNT